jgi:hypothetical protein
VFVQATQDEVDVVGHDDKRKQLIVAQNATGVQAVNQYALDDVAAKNRCSLTGGGGDVDRCAGSTWTDQVADGIGVYFRVTRDAGLLVRSRSVRDRLMRLPQPQVADPLGAGL